MSRGDMSMAGEHQADLELASLRQLACCLHDIKEMISPDKMR